jgi:PKD repeat protein
LCNYPCGVLFRANILAANDDYTLWPYSSTITLNTTAGGANVSGTVTNFPVLVRLNPGSFGGFAATLAKGGDIRFAKTDGTHLAYRIDRWIDNAGNNDTAEIWVKLDTVYGNNGTQSFMILWGKSGAADSSNGAAVFQAINGFAGMWHMSNDPAGGPGAIKDETVNANNGTCGNTMSAPDLVAAVVGRGIHFDGTDDGIDFQETPSLDIKGALTVSAWFKANTLTPWTRIATKAHTSNVYPYTMYGLMLDSVGQIRGEITDAGTQYNVNGSTILNTTDYFYATFTYDGSTLKLYVNGLQEGNTVSHAGMIDANTENFSIGKSALGDNFFNGIIDEVQLSSVARSADWIRLCYQNQRAGQTLVSVSAIKPSMAVISPGSVNVNLGASFTLTASVGFGTAPLSYQWQKNGASVGTNSPTYSVATAQASDSGSYTVKVSNDAGNALSGAVAVTVVLPVHAHLSASATAGRIPLPVTFIDSSSGVVTKRYWYFGDTSAIDSTASPVHVYSAAGTYTATLVVFDWAGRRADSMTTLIRTYNDNPVMISGRLVPPGRVEITYTNYAVLPTGPLRPFADSVALWYKPGSIPVSLTGATYAREYSPASMKSLGAGAPVKDTIALPQPLSDTVYGFTASVHWTDGAWSALTAGNGCLVLVKDTSAPVNVCGISGRYVGTDTAVILVSNLKAMDTSAVDSFGVWCGTAAADSMPDFASPSNARWFDLKREYPRLSGTGTDSIVFVNSQFNAGVVKTVWSAVIVRGKNGKSGRPVRVAFQVGVDRPANTITLSAHAQSASTVYLSWPALSGIEGIRIVYRTNGAVPINIYYFDTMQYSTAIPAAKDTFMAITGLRERTRYYFGAQVFKGGLWSVVTQASSANDSTPSAGAALDANRIKLERCTFDPGSDQIMVTFKAAGVAARDSLQAGISYSLTGFPVSDSLVRQVVPLSSGADTTVPVRLFENLRFNAGYFIALWERRADGAWTAATDSSRDTLTTPDFNWQQVSYFTKLGGDTAYAFNDNIRLMTDSVVESGESHTTDKVVIVHPDPGLFSGFVPASIAFKFAQPQSSARFYVGLKFSLPSPFSSNDLRVYRLHDSVWTAESTTTLDARSGYVSVKTNDLASAFMVLLDTQAVAIQRGAHADTVTEFSDLFDTVTVSDNAANVKWRFMCAKGGDAFSAGGVTAGGALGNRKSDRVIVHIPYTFVTGENGVRARLLVTDGVHSTVTDFSRQVRRSNSDYVRTEPMKWLPLRVTAVLDSPQVRYALRDSAEGAGPWTYDARNARLFKWDPGVRNGTGDRKWVEYNDNTADLFRFQPCGLVWIKTRQETGVNFGSGVTLPLTAAQFVSIAPNTFTDFALPYRFNVKVGDIIDSTRAGAPGADSLQIYAWERDSSGMFRTRPVYIADLATANLADRTATLGCLDLTGYTVFNPTAGQIMMRIPPVPEAMSSYGQRLPKRADKGGWAIKIRSDLSNKTRLTDLYCVYDPAKGGPLRYYPLAPTFERSYAGLYDPDAQKTFGSALTGKTANGGCAFQIAYVNQSPSEVRFTCTLEPIGEQAGPIKSCLYNSATGLREDAQPVIRVAAGQMEYRWLFVGSGEFLAKASVMHASMLRLEGVYPNPFRSMVRIKYSLPGFGVSAIKFTICDLRGRVSWHRELNTRGMSGSGVLLWNGETDYGRPMAAGTYLLRMTAFDSKQRMTAAFERKITLLQ